MSALSIALIRNSLFGESSLAEVKELNVSSKCIANLTEEVLAQLPNLTLLSLSFNKLTNLKGLWCLSSLSSLNVAHNQLTSLHGISSLTNLRQLNASHNKIISIEPVAQLVGLTDFFVQNNSLSIEMLEHLKQLTAVKRLCLSSNPGFKSSLPELKCLVLRSCPSLLMLDAEPVTDEERSASSALSEEEVSSTLLTLSLSPSLSLNTGPSSNKVKSSSSPGSPRGLAGYIFTPIPLPSYATQASPGKPPMSSPLTTSSRRNGSKPGTAASLPSRSSPAQGQRGRVLLPPLATPTGPRPASRSRSASIGAAPATEDGLGGNLSSPSLILNEESLAGVSPSHDNDNESVASFATSTKSSVTNRSRRSQGVPKIRELPEGSSFQDIIGHLPHFEPSKLPKVYSPSNTRASKKSPKPSPPESHEVVTDIKYGPVYQSRTAVSWRADGSVASNWPNGDIACTVDRDYASESSEVWRMLAMYKNFSVAVSWENPGGGFVQYFNGNIALSVNERGGTHYDQDGASVLQKWKWEDNPESIPSSLVVYMDPSSLVGAKFDTKSV